MSESSIKRWIDDGRIAATRTAGGHRRVNVEEAARYIRAAGLALERPERLRLPDLAAYTRRQAADRDTGETLYEHLVAGRADDASGLLRARFLARASVAQLIDGPLAQAMTRAGALWLTDPQGILAEHRATETAIQAVVRLRALLRPTAEGPLALGCAPAGDPYVLPSLAAAAVLEDEGFRAVNLGPETPLSTLELAVRVMRPRLVWISFSVVGAPAKLRREVLRLAEHVQASGAVLAVGGAQVERLGLPRDKPLYVGRSMVELRALALGLLHAARAGGRAGEVLS